MPILRLTHSATNTINGSISLWQLLSNSRCVLTCARATIKHTLTASTICWATLSFQSMADCRSPSAATSKIGWSSPNQTLASGWTSKRPQIMDIRSSRNRSCGRAAASAALKTHTRSVATNHRLWVTISNASTRWSRWMHLKTTWRNKWARVWSTGSTSSLIHFGLTCTRQKRATIALDSASQLCFIWLETSRKGSPSKNVSR